jgi:hypothetical protein
VAGKVEFLTPLCSICYSLTKSEKQKWSKIPDFWPFSRPARSQKTVHPSRNAYPSVSMQWLWPCDPFVAVALSRLEIKSYKAYKAFSHYFVLRKTWFALAKDGKK